MRQKRWLVAGGVAMALTIGAALGLGNSTAADEPVRVYLVHGGQAPGRGGSSTGFSHGITTFSVGGHGNVWPTQVFGYLDDIDEHWVVLKQVGESRKGLEIWIPRERVQLIEYMDDENFKVQSGPR